MGKIFVEKSLGLDTSLQSFIANKLKYFKLTETVSTYPELQKFIEKYYPKFTNMEFPEIVLVDATKRDNFNTDVCKAICGGFVRASANGNATTTPTSNYYIDILYNQDQYLRRTLYCMDAFTTMGFQFLNVYAKESSPEPYLMGGHNALGSGFVDERATISKYAYTLPNGDRIKRYTFNTNSNYDLLNISYSVDLRPTSPIYIHKVTLSNVYQ